MKILYKLILIFTLQGTLFNINATTNITVRVASYNVEYSKNATPEQIGKMFKPFNLDIIGFNEAPNGDWTEKIGKELGMKYSYVGKISSANHKDKYKTILSRTLLKDTEEYPLRKGCWKASAVRAITKIKGVEIAFYSLHICAPHKNKTTDHAYEFVTNFLSKEKNPIVIVVGDFNNKNIGRSGKSTIEEAGFMPIWRDLKIDISQQFTWNALNPKKNKGVIDHILYNISSGAKTTNGGIIELKKPLSDHKPIWAEIAFPLK